MANPQESDDSATSSSSGAPSVESVTPPLVYRNVNARKTDIYNKIMEIEEEDDQIRNPNFRNELEAHFDRFPISYVADVVLVRAFDILRHKRLLAEAETQKENIVCHIHLKGFKEVIDVGKSTKEKENENSTEDAARQEKALIPLHVITFAALDRPQLLSKLCTSLFDIGLKIHEAHVMSTIDGYALHVFVVDGWSTNEDSATLYAELETALAKTEFCPPQGQILTEGKEKMKEMNKGKRKSDQEETNELMKNNQKKTFSELLAGTHVPPKLFCPICEKQMVDATTLGRISNSNVDCKICPVTREVLLESSGFSDSSISVMISKWEKSHESLKAESIAIENKPSNYFVDKAFARKLAAGMSWIRAFAELTMDNMSSTRLLGSSLRLNLLLLHILSASEEGEIQEDILTIFGQWTAAWPNPENGSYFFIAPWCILLLKRGATESVQVKSATVLCNLFEYDRENRSSIGELGVFKCLVEMLEKSESQKLIKEVLRAIDHGCELCPSNLQKAVEANVVYKALRLILMGVVVEESVATLFAMKKYESAMYEVQSFGKMESLLDKVKKEDDSLSSSFAHKNRVKGLTKDFGISKKFKKVLYYAYYKILQIAREVENPP